MVDSTYVFDRSTDMIDLAIEIQSQVYWGGQFYCVNTSEEVDWKNFWSYLKSFQYQDGATSVHISDDSDVHFII